MDQYRVFGNPIKQSRSPVIHQAFAQQTQQLLNYQSQLVELDGFNQAVHHFFCEGGKGANVTLPFKEQALNLCDQLTERARLAGAVNTLSFDHGQILGDNTDGLGLVQDLINHGVQLANAHILLLGAGGAARGVILPLLDKDPASIVIANRTASKAVALCEQFQHSNLIASNFQQLGDNKFTVIINATSASLAGSIPAISPRVINVDTVCYDMVYDKELTPFLKWSKQHGAIKVIDGLGMLVGQAAESFNIWRGILPDTTPILNQLRKEV